jgi:hypothetical protein
MSIRLGIADTEEYDDVDARPPDRHEAVRWAQRQLAWERQFLALRRAAAARRPPDDQPDGGDPP